MVRVAILTITDGANYGNRLQNYAMQTVIKKMNYNVCTILRVSSRDISGIQKYKVIFKDIIKKIIRYGNTTFYYRKRKRAFDLFNADKIVFSKETLGYNRTLNNLNEKYDYFVCGSDQIWNAKFDIIKEDINNYLATFAVPSKRIAYAASFGTDEIAPGYEELFSRELKKFKALGIREKSGIDIVKKYSGREDAVLVLDPTLLLDANQWEQIEKKPKYIDEKPYILTYFLGGRNQKITEYINRIESVFGAKAINLDSEFKVDEEIEDNSVFTTAPDEFVWLIHHSECVLTDSFHAVAISILFGKRFCVFQRIAAEADNDMSGRIDTLLNMFGLSKMKDNLDKPTKIPEKYDIGNINERLSNRRKESMLFLENAFKIEIGR